MQINSNYHAQPAGKVTSAEARPRGVQSDPPAASFQSSESLERALRSTPDQRAGEIDRAKALVSESAYPPPETIRKISNLLALSLSSAKEV